MELQSRALATARELGMARFVDQWTSKSTTAVRRRAAPARAKADALTARAREVAALVARDYSNREIAASLVIAEGTAINHVKHILGKLDLSSRAQIAAWAVRHGVGVE
jgi:DNA-binding CsgD family transcriptional regulator